MRAMSRLGVLLCQFTPATQTNLLHEGFLLPILLILLPVSHPLSWYHMHPAPGLILQNFICLLPVHTVPRVPLGSIIPNSTNGASFQNAITINDHASSTVTHMTLPKLQDDNFWEYAPDNYVCSYEHAHAKFVYWTKSKREVQCIVVLLPSGITKENLNDDNYKVAECGKKFVVTFPAPDLFNNAD